MEDGLQLVLNLLSGNDCMSKLSELIPKFSNCLGLEGGLRERSESAGNKLASEVVVPVKLTGTKSTGKGCAPL